MSPSIRLNAQHNETKLDAQALVESGVKGKEGDSGSTDKYESHTQISNLTIIFANTRMILVKRSQVGVQCVYKFVRIKY